ncbi:DUF1634 domain-containing protein [Clostridium sp. PL3]|uniref:DUF1634 domain-containing protein n=1 Tax=Clostridium thailandense TaxID=2794346 RepID=A0A949U082_9CLOT|nr:DUF1634 domain-containing protein [Clostridium thailandense]MBV7273854.1 DUF1634 domain-containing protein [Clostridium thailandense]
MEESNIVEESNIGEIEIIISKSLRVGVVLSSVVILSGLLMFLISGHSGYSGSSYPTSPRDILAGAAALKPYGIILLGLMILIAIPVFRVGVSIIVFLKEKDYLYVKITTAVFIILIISLLMGKLG